LCAKVINAKVISFGVEREKYSKKNIRLATLARKFSFVMVVFSIVAIATGAFQKHDRCKQISETPVIAVAKFVNTPDDDFSYVLIQDLIDKCNEKIAVDVTQLDTFYNATASARSENMENDLGKVCAKSGIIVFGKRSNTSNLFDCSIYISRAMRNELAVTLDRGSEIIRLKQIDELEFSITKQSDIVSDFLVALFLYYKAEFGQAKEILQTIRENNTVIENEKVKLFIDVFLANSYIYSGEKDQGLSIYKDLIAQADHKEIIDSNWQALQANSIVSQEPFNSAEANEITAVTDQQTSEPINNEAAKNAQTPVEPKSEISTNQDNTNKPLKWEKVKCEKGTYQLVFPDGSKSHCTTIIEFMKYEGVDFAVLYKDNYYGTYNMKGEIIAPFNYMSQESAVLKTKKKLSRGVEGF
jgi:hypothetical protein